MSYKFQDIKIISLILVGESTVGEDTVGNIVGTIIKENLYNKNDFSYNITFPPNSSFEMRCLLLSLILKVHIDVN